MNGLVIQTFEDNTSDYKELKFIRISEESCLVELHDDTVAMENRVSIILCIEDIESILGHLQREYKKPPK